MRSRNTNQSPRARQPLITSRVVDNIPAGTEIYDADANTETTYYNRGFPVGKIDGSVRNLLLTGNYACVLAVSVLRRPNWLVEMRSLHLYPF
jgi:hypothetical protein